MAVASTLMGLSCAIFVILDSVTVKPPSEAT